MTLNFLFVYVCADLTQRIYCKDPGDIIDGRVYNIPPPNDEWKHADERKEQYPAGSQLGYSCEEGYILEGPTVLNCLSNGSWSSIPPTCTFGKMLYVNNFGHFRIRRVLLEFFSINKYFVLRAKNVDQLPVR